MIVKAVLKKGRAYQYLYVDGDLFATVYGRAEVTEKVYCNQTCIMINESRNFFWADVIEWEDEATPQEEEEEELKELEELELASIANGRPITRQELDEIRRGN